MPTDLPRRPNPWIDLLLPMSDAATFLEEVQATITPVVPGDAFSLLLIPLRASKFTRPLFRTADEEFGVGFDPLRRFPRYRRRTRARIQPPAVRPLPRARRLAVPDRAVRLDAEDWAAHYGEQWDRLLAAKRRFDRGDVLASGPDILGRAQHQLSAVPYRQHPSVKEAAAGQEQRLDPHDRRPGAVDERFEAGVERA